MADPAGTALGVLGLVGTVLQLFSLGYVTADRKDQVIYLRGQLDLEALLLRRWAESALTVRSAYGVEGVKVIPAEYCRIVYERMSLMLKLFDASAGLVSKYGADLPVEPLSSMAQLAEPSEQQHIRIFRVLSRLNTCRPNAFKWAIRDAARLEEMLKKIETIRNKLQELLPLDIELIKL